jgi:hypothetical protein
MSRASRKRRYLKTFRYINHARGDNHGRIDSCRRRFNAAMGNRPPWSPSYRQRVS